MAAILQPIAISILAFALGYQVRNYINPPFVSAAGGPHTRRPSAAKKAAKEDINLTDAAESAKHENESEGASDSDSEVDTDSEAEDLALALSSNPQTLKPTSFDEVKLVLVVNESLKMTKGKIAAQAGHATLSCALMMKEVNPRMYKHWERHGSATATQTSDSNADADICIDSRRLRSSVKIQRSWRFSPQRRGV